MNANMDEVKLLLAPYIETIRYCVHTGFQDFKSINPEYILSLEVRSRANFIRDRIVSHIKKEFYQNTNIQVIEDCGLFLIQVENKIRIRFNKLNDELTISSDNTKRTKLFLQQEELFPEFKTDVTNLIAGYKVDSLWEDISFYISCPNGRIVSWSMNMDETKSTIDFATYENVTSSTTSERVKIKSDINKKVVNYGTNS